MKKLNFTNSQIWWGPPKKFDTKQEERKISWLELFYDLVYVIAISKTTHHLASHPDFSGLLDYIYIFGLIFWGWLNGSLYHDLHGNSGVRTRLMTFWQMSILGALIVTTFGNQEHMLFRATISLLVMQLYITYLWWSVGIYDKEHRKLNKPYNILYLLAAVLLVATFFVEQPYKRAIFYISLFVNYLPPFFVAFWKKSKFIDHEFALSSAMTERLGLFTIILFGEAVLGVINGVTELDNVSGTIWLQFALGLLVVFALWWIFFAVIADRDAKIGFLVSHKIQILYALTLMSLGMFSSTYSKIFKDFENLRDVHAIWIKQIFGISLSVFLLGITLISRNLEYPKNFDAEKFKFRKITYCGVVLILLVTFFNNGISLTIYLAILFFILLFLVIYITRVWFLLELAERNKQTS